MKIVTLLIFATIPGCITVNVTPPPEPPPREPTIFRVVPRDDAPAETGPGWNVMAGDRLKGQS